MRVFYSLISFMLVLISLLSPSLSVIPAQGAEELKPYAYCAIGSTVYLCSTQDDTTALFAIPETYCVSLISENGGWYYCRYADDVGIYRGVTGYCRTTGLVPIDEPLENLFLNMPVTITYRSDISDETLPSLGEIEVTAAYYGAYRMAATNYSYVLYNTSFGYVRKDYNSYPLNTLPTVEEEPDTKEPQNYTLIVVIAILAIAAFAVAVIYFSSSKKYKH